jgi:hypothetical protein
MKKLVWGSLAFGWILLGAAAAHAQEEICGSIAAQPEAVFDRLVDEVGPFFPIVDEAVCEKLVKAAISACHSAVVDTAACLDSLAGNVAKTTKPACSITKSPSACNADAKGQAEAERADIEAAAEDAHDVCHDEFAEDLFFACLEGFPM